MKEFHITIGSSPDGDMILNNDLNLIKASLLYGDKIRLISCKASILEWVHSAFDLTEKERFKFLEDFFEIFYKNNPQMLNRLSLIKQIRSIYNKKHKTPKEIIFIKKNSHILNESWADFLNYIEDKEVYTGYQQLIEAKDLGLLTIHKFENIKDTNISVNEFINILGESIENKQTFPLLDFISADLMNSGIKEGKMNIDLQKINRGKHCSIAAELFEKLPLFENASVGEILDIRKELSKYLIRFRSAMLEFSDEISSEIWDNNFVYDVDNLMFKKIEPIILEIEENIKSNNAIKVFLKELATKSIVPIGSTAIGLFISDATSIPQWLPPALGTGSIAYKSLLEYYKEKRNIENNKMFLYYKAKKLLQ